MNTIIIVTGERDWTDKETIYRVLDEELVLSLAYHEDRGLWSEFSTEERARFVLRHGKCKTGADAIANSWAIERGVTVERFQADWYPLGGGFDPTAGPVRNTKMARAEPRATKCCAFWSGKMRTRTSGRESSGTLDMIKAALLHQIPVRVEPPRVL